MSGGGFRPSKIVGPYKGLDWPSTKQQLLRGYTICSARLIAGARKGRRLLRELPDVVADFRDTFVEFGEGGCDHEGSHFPEKSPRWRRFLSYSTIL